MLADAYDFRLHAYVAVPGTFDGRPLEIVHAPQGRVWVSISYADEMPEGAVLVGDGQNDGIDAEGSRLISVPRSICRFYTEDEADQVFAMEAADQKLLSYAR